MYPSLTSLVSLLWEQLWDFGLFVPRRMKSPSANPFNFSAVTSFVCVREVEPWQDHKKSLLYSPREVGVLRAHTAQSRGPLKCHRVYKGSFSTLKKKITTGRRILLLLISDKKTRDQRPQGSYPKPHSSDPDSSAHPLVDVVDASLGASPGPIMVPILNPRKNPGSWWGQCHVFSGWQGLREGAAVCPSWGRYVQGQQQACWQVQPFPSQENCLAGRGAGGEAGGPGVLLQSDHQLLWAYHPWASLHGPSQRLGGSSLCP